MSVIVKNMEMPKTCDYCKFHEPFLDFAYCDLGEMDMEYKDIVNRRHPDCPLVEIPTPHGNLKDESDIISLIEVMFCKDKDGMEHAIQCVKDAPTVIEAEGSET